MCRKKKKKKPIPPNSIKNTPNTSYLTLYGERAHQYGCIFIKQVLNYISHFTKVFYLWFGKTNQTHIQTLLKSGIN